MALRYGYFDSDIIGVDDEGMPIFDRAETSDLFALLFSSLVSDGVLASPSNCFRVRAANDGLKLEIDPGFGMVKGHFCYDEEVSRLTIAAAPQTYSRIDRVVMRCNYLQKMVEIIIKTGTEAANPAPPELVRPAAGDFFELCLANVRLAAGQKVITQSSITDTRPDSSLCGYITQLIDHLDTAVFYEQLNVFYREFVDKSNVSYEQFKKMAADAYAEFSADVTEYINVLKKNSTDAYNTMMAGMNERYTTLTESGQALYDRYAADISAYLTQLELKGDTDLAAITQQLLLFKATNEAAFRDWFEHVKGTLDDDTAGHLQTGLDAVNSVVEDLRAMLLSGMVRTKLKTDQGDFITDSTGKPLLIGWPICGCNK